MGEGLARVDEGPEVEDVHVHRTYRPGAVRRPGPTPAGAVRAPAHLRRAARRALDTLLALPRGAAGWVLRQARTVLSALGSNPALAAARRPALRARRPDPVGRADHRRRRRPQHPRRLAGHRPSRALPRLQGRRRRHGALAADPLTARQARPDRHPDRHRPRHRRHGSPPSGRRRRRPPGHPDPRPRRGLRGGLVRPVSQSVVVHRLLGRLVGASWLRWAIELLALPLVLAPSLVIDLGAGLRRPRSVPSGHRASRARR